MSARDLLAEKLQEAWFTAEPGIPLGQRWYHVADVAAAELMPPPGVYGFPVLNTYLAGDGITVNGETPAPDDPPTLDEAFPPRSADEPIPGWELPEQRDHAYDLRITYPDGSECRDCGTATGDELAHRLRFEANLCVPAKAVPVADEVVDGAPTWFAHDAPAGFPKGFTAWNNGITTSRGDLIEDIDGLESTARAALAAVAQARAWRRQL